MRLSFSVCVQLDARTECVSTVAKTTLLWRVCRRPPRSAHTGPRIFPPTSTNLLPVQHTKTKDLQYGGDPDTTHPHQVTTNASFRCGSAEQRASTTTAAAGAPTSSGTIVWPMASSVHGTCEPLVRVRLWALRSPATMDMIFFRQDVSEIIPVRFYVRMQKSTSLVSPPQALCCHPH